MLRIKNLSIGYQTDKGMVKAVNGINLSLEKGKILGLVGESGSGKSTVLYALMGLLSYPGKILEGEIIFDGSNITNNSKEQWRKLRGKEITMVFQDPMTTLNPAYKVGNQIKESLLVHKSKKSFKDFFFKKKNDQKEEVKSKVLDLMNEVGIPSPDARYKEYPHQFSGGMQQRAIIAISLANIPKLLLADEPTTALDVTIQAQILDLLKRINQSHQTSIIFVTHDLAVAAEFCDEIAVMYAGQIVERGHVDEIIENPKHPYTKGLLNSIPKIGFKEKIKPITGNIIDLIDLKKGCPFAERCEFVSNQCSEQLNTIVLKNNHEVRCILYGKEDLIEDEQYVSNGSMG